MAEPMSIWYTARPHRDGKGFKGWIVTCSFPRRRAFPRVRDIKFELVEVGKTCCAIATVSQLPICTQQPNSWNRLCHTGAREVLWGSHADQDIGNRHIIGALATAWIRHLRTSNFLYVVGRRVQSIRPSLAVETWLEHRIHRDGIANGHARTLR